MDALFGLGRHADAKPEEDNKTLGSSDPKSRVHGLGYRV